MRLPDANEVARAAVVVLRHPVGWFSKAWWRLEVRGREHMPKAGPVILSANHLSFIDPVIVTLAAGRRSYYLAIDELFGKSAGFDRMTRFFGAVPTPRGRPPIAALREGIARLEQGEPLVVFPEGRRVEQWGTDHPANGAAWLSLLTGAPVVPIAIVGTENVLSKSEPRFKRTALTMWIEEPLDALDFIDHADPVGAMMLRWHEVVAARVATGDGLAAQPGEA
ncbi:MAG TPA: lysophospholipid acyltransferase family protein [Acidimicrobiia bacterium]